jgi:hypothetical protein
MNKLLIILVVLIVATATGCGDSHEFYTTPDTELKLDINLFETNRIEYDNKYSKNLSYAYIYIGKVNSKYISEAEEDDSYYIQLNDLLTTSTSQIEQFLHPGHGKFENQRIMIIADKDTPEELLQKVEYSITYNGWYRKKQIFYLEKNGANGTSGFNHQPTRIEHTSTPKFDNKKYISFIKNLIEDSLNYNWVYVHPVHIKMDIALEVVNDTNQEIQVFSSPPPPPTMQFYKSDSLTFNENQFSSIKIFKDEKVYQKAGDSLFDYYGRGIIISLPYSHKSISEVFIDYEIVDWGWCGTGKYQTIVYKSK